MKGYYPAKIERKRHAWTRYPYVNDNAKIIWPSSTNSGPYNTPVMIPEIISERLKDTIKVARLQLLYIARELPIHNLWFWRLSGNDLYRGENPNRCRGLGIISKLQTFSNRVQRPSRERPEALSQKESGFSYGQWTLTTSVQIVWEEPSKRS